MNAGRLAIATASMTARMQSVAEPKASLLNVLYLKHSTTAYVDSSDSSRTSLITVFQRSFFLSHKFNLSHPLHRINGSVIRTAIRPNTVTCVTTYTVPIEFERLLSLQPRLSMPEYKLGLTSPSTSPPAIFHAPLRAPAFMYGSSKVATMISYLRARNALPGKSRLIVGMWMMNWIPLIIPHS